MGLSAAAALNALEACRARYGVLLSGITVESYPANSLRPSHQLR